MTGQLDSPHFFRTGDVIRAIDGRVGVVLENSALYAVVEWEGKKREEVEQFDPDCVVIERLNPA